MSDEVYEGAIGIDLGTLLFFHPAFITVHKELLLTCFQARPTRVLPTMRAPTSKSVSQQ